MKNKVISLVRYLRRYGIFNTIIRIIKKLLIDNIDYFFWKKNNEKYNTRLVNQTINNFKVKPKYSILVPVYNVEERFLRECIDSVLNQYYKSFELILIDDTSTEEHVKIVLNEYKEKDSRIKVIFRKTNGHIARATNTGLEIASGEYVGLLDNDDTLAPHALYEVTKKINLHPEADLIYSDEDLITESGKRIEPHFKPKYSPDTLLSKNYINHFGVYRTKILKKIKGFRHEYVGAQDYDMILRFTEETKNICHISKVLYHWRKTKTSVASGISAKNYALTNGKKAIEDALKRRKIKGDVFIEEVSNHYFIKYEISKKDKVSIIIPTKNHASDLKKCLESIYEKTDINIFEIIIVNNGSSEPELFDIFKEYQKKHKNFKVLNLDIPFNFSKLNNEAVKIASGNYILLLNNDIEIITNNWLKTLIGFASQSHIGAVGAKLLYPDDTIQHGGVMLGMGGIAGHMYVKQPRDTRGRSNFLKTPSNVSAVTAAALLIEKKKYLEVEGMEENLEVAFNDIDFCLKLLKKGYYNILVPGIEMYHFESKSRGLENTKEKKKRFFKEITYIKNKWKEKIENDDFFSQNLLKDSSCNFINTRKQKSGDNNDC